eukprot:GHVS01073613.1.p1 GENE.GHVS01073613.1~~GHVS01073613.1.p1  ORF type:complete len:125 (+),score=24.99 GHVS01073613.1:271-645(+)
MSFFLNLMGGSPTSQRPPPTANATQDETATANATANATERGYAGVMLTVGFVTFDVIAIVVLLVLWRAIVRLGLPQDRNADQKTISRPNNEYSHLQSPHGENGDAAPQENVYDVCDDNDVDNDV